MSTYRKILIHIVFATRNRIPVLKDDSRKDLYRYIWGICKNKDCHLIRVGGYRDHIHLLVDLHPSIAIADFIRTIKNNSSRWMKENGEFPEFDYWQEGYWISSISPADREKVRDYIRNQETHHKQFPFLEELEYLVNELGLEMDRVHLP